MTVQRGLVRSDGTSSLVNQGVYDMASAAQEPISPELEAKLASVLSALNPVETDARFKLEAFFRGGMRKGVPVRAVVSCWTNGGFLNGGGDASVYLCPQPTGGGNVCLEPIDLQFAAGGRVVCTKCRRVSKTMDLVGQIINEVPMERWAQILVKLFHVLGCSADLRICVERESMQKAIELEKGKGRGGEAYAHVAAQRSWIVYRLADIIKDTAGGSALEQRFRAFLEA